MLPEKVISQVSTCQDLVQCAYSLNDFEVKVYNMLTETGPLRADELADQMGRDRSTVYRALQKMLTCGMVHRETQEHREGWLLPCLSGHKQGRAQGQAAELRGRLVPPHAIGARTFRRRALIAANRPFQVPPKRSYRHQRILMR